MPGSHTDGVFAIIGEELGFIGLMAILALFAFFVYRGLKVDPAAPQDQLRRRCWAMGIVSWIAYQTLINIGGITRSIPLTGVPLPFLSYGGSALIAVMAGVGILLSVSRYSRRPRGDPAQAAAAQRYARRRPGRREGDGVRLVLSGGGTGGHVYPALAVADACSASCPPARRWTSLYLGSASGAGADARRTQAGFPFRDVSARRRSAAACPGRWPRTPARSRLGVQAGRAGILREFRPQVVLSTGGYASFPVALAARSRGIPIAVYLPDSTPAGPSARSPASPSASPSPPSRALRQPAQRQDRRHGLPGPRRVLAGEPRRRAAAAPGLDPEEKVLFVAGASSRGAQHQPGGRRRTCRRFWSYVKSSTSAAAPTSLARRDPRQGLPAELRARYHLYGYMHDEFPWAMAAADLAVLPRRRLRDGRAAGRGPARRPRAPTPTPAATSGSTRATWRSNGAAVILDDDDLDELLPWSASSCTTSAAARDERGRPAAGPAERGAPHRHASCSSWRRAGGMNDTAVRAIPQRVHLVGVGGIHMSGIAQILRARGHSVSGSDLHLSPLTDRRSSDWASPSTQGHDAANIDDAELVVYTSAAHEDNPELAEARRRGLPTIKRAEMVARLHGGQAGASPSRARTARRRPSSLIAFMLWHAPAARPDLHDRRRDPSTSAPTPCRATGHDFVVEADEYDRAFLNYHPYIAVVTNIEPDHLDIYGSLRGAAATRSRQFLSQVDSQTVTSSPAEMPLPCRPSFPRL